MSRPVRTRWPKRWRRPSSRDMWREARLTSELCRERRVEGSSSSDSGCVLKSVDVLFSSVGTADVGGELLSFELVMDAVSEGCRRVSGYSSSKRWIMPWRVWSRKSRRPAAILASVIGREVDRTYGSLGRCRSLPRGLGRAGSCSVCCELCRGGSSTWLLLCLVPPRSDASCYVV